MSPESTYGWRVLLADPGPLLLFEDRLSPLELLDAHDHLVSRALGQHPMVVIVPAHLGLVSEGDVDQHLVATLAVPDLVAGVARVEQDVPDRALRPSPGAASAVSVAARILRRRRQDAVLCESRGDGVVAGAGQELPEDALHDPGRLRVGLESVEALAVGCFARVRVRSGVGEAVAVWRAPAEEAALDGGLSCHRRAAPSSGSGCARSCSSPRRGS